MTGPPTHKRRTARGHGEPKQHSSFSQYSYGFRPNCRGLDAVRRINSCINEGFRWSVDIDLKSFFDKVPQARALEALRERLDGDGPVVRLIKRYLQAGYVELGAYHDTPAGMPQAYSPASGERTK